MLRFTKSCADDGAGSGENSFEKKHKTYIMVTGYGKTRCKFERGIVNRLYNKIDVFVRNY